MPRISDQDRAVRRQRILDAAWRRLATNGYHETTIDDVCDEAGVSKGAFYGYFDTKQALFLALLEEETEALNGVAARARRARAARRRARSPFRSGHVGGRRRSRSRAAARRPVGGAAREIRSSAPRSPRRSSGAERLLPRVDRQEHRRRRPRHRAAPRQCACVDPDRDGGRADAAPGARPARISLVEHPRGMDALIAGIDRSPRRHDPSAGGRGLAPRPLAVPATPAAGRCSAARFGARPDGVGRRRRLGAGLGAVAFRELILRGVHDCSRDTPTTAPPGTSANPNLPLARHLVRRARVRSSAASSTGRSSNGSRTEASGHGVPEVMLAVSEQGGRIRPPRRRRQVAGLGALHRLGRLGRPRGPDRPDRLGARLGLGQLPAHARDHGCGCWSPAAPPAESPPPSTRRSPASSSPWS